MRRKSKYKIFQDFTALVRHSPSGLPLDGKIAGRGRADKHFFAPDRAWPRAVVLFWVFQAEQRGRPRPFEVFFSAYASRLRLTLATATADHETELDAALEVLGLIALMRLE
ncbi:MAG: hypothetical protein ACQEUH_15115, partial [Pseudomonadota bacterium]